MNTVLRSASLLAVLALGATASSLEDRVALRWKLATGESLRYRITQDQTIESEMIGEITNNSAFVIRQDVSAVATDGTADLELRYEAIRLENGGPAAMSYDSTLTGEAAKRNDSRLAKIFEPMLGAKLGMKLEPTGRVAALSGVDAMLADAFDGLGTAQPGDPTAMLKEMFTEDSMRKLVELNVFPTDAIEAGHAWNRTVEQKLPMFGSLKISLDNTFTGVEEHAGSRCAKISVAGTMSLEPSADQAVPMELSIESPTISGVMYFALENGRLVEMLMDTTMDMHMSAGGESGKGFEMDMSISSSQRQVLIAKDAPFFE